MKLLKSKLTEIITEEIQNYISLEQEVNEGIIKNLTLATLLAFPGLINAQPYINPVEKEKIVNVVQNNNELTFKNIEDFNKHFQKNIEQFKKLAASSRTNEITVVIDGVAYKGKVGLSKDMQTVITRISIPGKNPNYRSSFRIKDSYVAYVLYRM